jgi:hypothetical protein
MAVTTFLVFVIPIIVITVLYVLMGITLYKTSHRPLNNNEGKRHEQILIHHHGQDHVLLRKNTASIIKSRPIRNSRRAVLKMLGRRKDFRRNLKEFFGCLVAVVIAFFICWAPFHTQRITAFVTRLLDKANKNIASDAATKFQEILFFTSGKTTKSIKKTIHILFFVFNRFFILFICDC